MENVQEDCQPEIYKDYKELKNNMMSQKEENILLQKTIDKISRETAE